MIITTMIIAQTSTIASGIATATATVEKIARLINDMLMYSVKNKIHTVHVQSTGLMYMYMYSNW